MERTMHRDALDAQTKTVRRLAFEAWRVKVGAGSVRVIQWPLGLGTCCINSILSWAGGGLAVEVFRGSAPAAWAEWTPWKGDPAGRGQRRRAGNSTA